MNARAWLAALVLVLVGTVAMADDALDARYFDARGRTLYAAGEFDAALDAFLHAHRIAPSASTLYNVALTAALAREDALAWRFFEAYRSSGAVDPARMADALARQETIAGRVAVIAITSEPAGARVFVDRRDLGVSGITPLRVAVTSGSHRIIVEADRHASRDVEVGVEVGRVTPLHVPLRATTGTARFVGVPPGARVVVVRDDGVEREVTTAVAELVVGRYEARLESAQHEASSVRFEVRERGTADIAFVARGRVVATGRVVVRSTPRATVYVDGTARAPTPVVLADVPVGVRRVELRAPGHATEVREVDVRRDSSSTIDAVLDPTR